MMPAMVLNAAAISPISSLESGRSQRTVLSPVAIRSAAQVTRPTRCAILLARNDKVPRLRILTISVPINSVTRSWNADS
jgi:hypothetical protein